MSWIEITNDNELKNLYEEIIYIIYEQNGKPLTYYQKNKIEKSPISIGTEPISYLELSKKFMIDLIKGMKILKKNNFKIKIQKLVCI